MSGGNGRLRFGDSFTLDGDAVTAAAAARLGVMAITLRHLEDTCDDGGRVTADRCAWRRSWALGRPMGRPRNTNVEKPTLG